jgi:hypothetical protein
MKKLTFAVLAAFVLVSAGVSASVHAQTYTTPVFYDQNGNAVNPNGTAEPAGYYYNSSGQQVYYYGNGTYYNPSTGTYGGSVNPTTTYTAPGATPVFYNAPNGTAANPGGTPLNAGYYYASNGDQVYYYGNGTYYDPTTQTYGGQAFGTSASLVPGVPNTGAGGMATETWLVLLASLAIAGSGIAFITRRTAIR